MRDRRRYLHWLFEAKKRFGLSVLNYMITSNHVHLLIKDTRPNVIADSAVNCRPHRQNTISADRRGVLEDRYRPQLRPTSTCIAAYHIDRGSRYRILKPVQLFQTFNHALVQTFR
jgi:hypothetical protein